MKNKPIKWGFKFWFGCGAKSGYFYEFAMYLGKKGNTEFGYGKSAILSLCQKLKDMHCFVFFDHFFKSPALLVKLLEIGIYVTGTVWANQKNMPVLKHDKDMKHSEYDWFSSNHLSAIKWMDNTSVIILSNYFNPKETKQIERRVRGSKDKVKVTCPSVIQEYNQFMGGVDLSDEMKVTYEVDCWSKFHFYLCIFFDFLDIAILNSKIFYNKIESAPSLSSLKFRYSIAQTMIQKFSSRKRTVLLPTPSKRSSSPSFDIVDHLPDFTPSRVCCAFCSSKNLESRTYVRCITCNNALCLQKDCNCFQQYHTKQ